MVTAWGTCPEASGVHPALLEVQLPLERPQHVVVDRAIRAQTQERLALRLEHGAMDLAVLDDLPVFLPGAGRVPLPLDVLRAVLVGLAQPIEQRAMARPHRIELIEPAQRGLDQLLAREGLFLAQLGVGAEPERAGRPRQ